MKLPIHDLQNNKKGDQELPKQFSEEYRPDLIRRAVLSLQSRSRQRYGTDPEAGQRHSSELSKRRRKYRGCYGFGISRVNRKIHSRLGCFG
jgi:ribosomal protein L4